MVRSDRDKNGGGIIVYINDFIPYKLLDRHNIQKEMELLFIEIRINNQKYLIIAAYHPPNQSDPEFIGSLSSALNVYIKDYENIIILGDLNMEKSNTHLDDLMTNFNLDPLIKEPTCFKSINRPSCIDHILTNKKHQFFNSMAIENGISDFHKCVATVLRSKCLKSPPVTKYYRSYKYYSQDGFMNSFNENLSKTENLNYESFHGAIITAVDKHAPLKKKIVRANNSPFMTKELRKAIMNRSRYKNKYLKHPSRSNHQAYKRSRNNCVTLLRSTKRNYYRNLNMKNLSGNREFWKQTKPLISKKSAGNSKIILKENNRYLTNDQEIANIMNHYFVNITDSLNLNLEHKIDDIDEITEKYKDHPSIVKIKRHHNQTSDHIFHHVTQEDIIKEINKLSANKSVPTTDIPIRIMKCCKAEISKSLQKIFNNDVIDKCTFPNKLKYAEVVPIFKKKEKTLKNNYRPISLLPSIAKIFERLLSYQLNTFFENKFSDFLGAYRKGFNAQHALTRLLEFWKKEVDEGKVIGAVLMDLSKAFDTIDHNLLIAKLNAYGMDRNSVSIILSYLKDRKQRLKINSSFSDFLLILVGVPQGSILGPILFNIFINDIFYFLTCTEMCNYADDNTIYTSASSINTVKSQLLVDTMILLDWFSSNHMVLNLDKCQFICFGIPHLNVSLEISNLVLHCQNHVTLLGINIDQKLSFDKHIKSLCKRASSYINIISRLTFYLNFDQTKSLMNAYFLSQFSYCPLVWMFCPRTSLNRVNSLHERSLRILYPLFDGSYQDLLKMSGEDSIHQRHLQTLVKHIFMFLRGDLPKFMESVFALRSVTYHLRKCTIFVQKHPNTVRYGLETVSYRAGQIWNLVPDEIKNSASVKIFSRKIKLWKCEICPCRLCKTYVQSLGFL